MFNGLIKHIGVVQGFTGEVISVKSALCPKIGASIAINGICTTVTDFRNGIFSASLSDETQSKIALENLAGRVHLEEALRLNERIDGHIVQGHIDSVGTISRIVRGKSGIDFFIDYEPQIRPLLVPKGSVAIDGVSLTINALDSRAFRLTIVPHTFENTLFCSYKPARRVNIETDIFNRSVYHIMQHLQNAQSPDTAHNRAWQAIDFALMSY